MSNLVAVAATAVGAVILRIDAGVPGALKSYLDIIERQAPDPDGCLMPKSIDRGLVKALFNTDDQRVVFDELENAVRIRFVNRPQRDEEEWVLRPARRRSKAVSKARLPMAA